MSDFRDYVEYYRYGYNDDVPVIPGKDPHPTEEEVEEAIAEALESINLVPGADDRTYILDIQGRDAGEIVIPEDKYLDGIDVDEASKEVTFKITNGESVTVPLTNLDDPNIDCSTF